MNTAEIRQRMSNGFRPFELQLSSGRRLPVPHPDYIAARKGTVVVLDERGLASVIDALHIVSLDDLPVRRRRRDG